MITRWLWSLNLFDLLLIFDLWVTVGAPVVMSGQFSIFNQKTC